MPGATMDIGEWLRRLEIQPETAERWHAEVVAFGPCGRSDISLDIPRGPLNTFLATREMEPVVPGRGPVATRRFFPLAFRDSL
jgi:hypothetical protein